MLEFIIDNAGRSQIERGALDNMIRSLLTEGPRQNEPITLLQLSKPVQTTAANQIENNVGKIEWPLRVKLDATTPDGKPTYWELTEGQALRYTYSAGSAARHGCTRAVAMLCLAAAGQELPVYSVPAKDGDATGITLEGLRNNLSRGAPPDKPALLAEVVRLCKGDDVPRETSLLPLFAGFPGCRGNQQKWIRYARLMRLPDCPPPAELLALPQDYTKELAERAEATFSLRVTGAEKAKPVATDPATVAAQLADKKAALLAYLATMPAADLRAVLAAMVSGMDAGAVESLAKLAGLTPEPAAPAAPEPAAPEPAAPVASNKKHDKK